ncbi:hypothetical protein HMPREF2656_08985 [Corynebacterium sp. HMSC034B08]|uniref:hypothetical protein n=1 Tax=Corynebacterium sp. HMSC034B08 TaxID=1715135 RepID=UPI0008A9AF53|nr:hypothetical protein [Corynebacterium sp. HMSC034B08]OHO31665.1 hypothetical protein HMPREF2656_08985 [Corynebacterium sp. HMSC034B08]
MNAPLLETLTEIADRLDLPIAVSLFSAAPAPDTYLVATPIADTLEVFADNTPSVEVEEVRLSLFTAGNYLPWRDRLTHALVDAGLVVTARRYIGVEDDTGYHHYSFDISCHHPF